MAKRSGGTRSIDGSTKRLLKKIEDLPHSDALGRQSDLVNPIPYVGKDISREIYLNQDRWYDNEMGEKSIELSKIETIQPLVSKSTLVSKIGGRNDTEDIPVVYYKGRYILFDGNHTVAIRKLRGDESVKVKLFRYV